MSEAIFQCRNCLSFGGTAVLDDPPTFSIGGEALLSAPLLPRCTCYTRLHKGKLPATIANIVSGLPVVPELSAIANAANVKPPPAVVPERDYDTDEPRRPVYSAEALPASRSVEVYSRSRQDGSLLGSVTLTNEHKLADVQKLLKKQNWGRGASVQMYRSEKREEGRTPLHKQQMQRLAMPFFPTDDYCIVVD